MFDFGGGNGLSPASRRASFSRGGTSTGGIEEVKQKMEDMEQEFKEMKDQFDEMKDNFKDFKGTCDGMVKDVLYLCNLHNMKDPRARKVSWWRKSPLSTSHGKSKRKEKTKKG